jgi:uncharacterized membrane protein YgdD (TMEM256/DUF423 family)
MDGGGSGGADRPADVARGRTFGVAGAVFAFLGIAAGAFGAHGLRSRLDPAMLQVYETAVRYQIIHALALLIVWLAADRVRGREPRVVGWLFVVGIVLFSGSLYAMALTGVRAWGAVTPFGGLCFLIGWLCLAWAIAGRK